MDSQSHVGLLLVTFWRSLERFRVKLNRLQPSGGLGDASERLPDRDSIVRLLSDRSRTILALRSAGYEWSDIAKLLNSCVAVIKGDFWRELHRIREKLK